MLRRKSGIQYFIRYTVQKRSTNQDYAGTYVNRAGYQLFLLADGWEDTKQVMSQVNLLVEDLGKLWSETFFDAGTPEATLEIWLKKIKFVMKMKIIASLGKLDEYQGMGTTLEALVIKAGMLVSAHVGDSRTYLMRDGELNKITTDHSLVQELVDAGQITEEEAEVHPNKNIITRSLGQTSEVQADNSSFRTSKLGTYYLMNSDGLTNMVSTTEIMEVLERKI